MPSARDLGLRCDDLVERAAEMNGAGALAARQPPGDRPVERPVDLEGARPVPICLESTAIAAGEARSGDPDELPRRHLEQKRPGGRQVVDRLDPGSCADLAPQRAQVARERVGDRLRAAASHRPADRVPESAEEETEGRARSAVERQNGVSREPGEQRARPLTGERSSRNSASRPDGSQAEAADREGVARNAQRGRKQVTHERLRVRRQRGVELRPGAGVRPQCGARVLEGALEHDRRLVVERVGERRGGVNQLQAVLGERDAAEERRGERERVKRGADVVAVAGKRELGGATPAADRVGALEHQDGASGAGDLDRRGEPVRTRADDHGIERLAHAFPSTPSERWRLKGKTLTIA